MDPDANLREQRDLIAKILDHTQNDSDDFDADAMRLAELAQALDEWLMKGGSLPRAWALART